MLARAIIACAEVLLISTMTAVALVLGWLLWLLREPRRPQAGRWAADSEPPSRWQKGE